MDGLAERLRAWGAERGWTGGLVIPREHFPDVIPANAAFRVGPVTGYGRTTNEAVNRCADALVGDGWPDDRDHPTDDFNDWGVEMETENDG